MPVLFAMTLFISAAILFLVQPMVGKKVLPLFGGSPAVWNTCMVFYQAVLLLGYLYAHKLTSLKSQKAQISIHLVVLAVAGGLMALASLLTESHTTVPILTQFIPQDEAFPFLNVLATLTIAVGVPFFAVSTSAPLLQRWFTTTGHPSAKDPYFLYAASNVGSLLSLLSYPLLIEPLFTITQQTWLFAGGMVLLMVFTLLCARATLHPLKPPSLMEQSTETVRVERKPTGRQAARWLAMSLIPSSLMLGVTNHLTTDIAAIPLLWIIPLGLYLLTFIVAFAKGAQHLRGVVGLLAPVLLLLLVFTMTSGLKLTVFVQIALHLVVYFFLVLMLHLELAATRPNARYLTNFYLWISLGGVLGGLFNALLAPLIFPWAIEYTLAMVAACFFVPGWKDIPSEGLSEKQIENRTVRRIVLDALTLPVLLISSNMLLSFSYNPTGTKVTEWIADQLNALCKFVGLGSSIGSGSVATFLFFAPPCLLAFFTLHRPVRFGLAVLGIVFVMHYVSISNKYVIDTRRSYFGVLQIRHDTINAYELKKVPPTSEDDYPKEWNEYPAVMLSHGTTVHGRQFADEKNLPKGVGKETPLTYYHPDGPVGDLFRDTFLQHPNDVQVGMVGLGTGSVAGYMQKGQNLTFFEIDPKVLKIVETPQYFSYFSSAKARGANIDVIIGDARLTLDRAKERKFHLLLIDAFSSDAIPIHLMTEQAMLMYMERLTDDGLLAFHVSNRYLRLDPVLAAIADRCGMTCLIRTDYCEVTNGGQTYPNPDVAPGRTSCGWVVLAKKPERLERTFTNPDYSRQAGVVGGPAMTKEVLWNPIERLPCVTAWTDDYADVLSVFTAPEVIKIRKSLGFKTLDDK